MNEAFGDRIQIMHNDWFNKGFSLAELGKHNEAIDCYDKVLEIDPNSVYAWNGKANALNGLGEYTEAIKFYDKLWR